MLKKKTEEKQNISVKNSIRKKFMKKKGKLWIVGKIENVFYFLKNNKFSNYEIFYTDFLSEIFKLLAKTTGKPRNWLKNDKMPSGFRYLVRIEERAMERACRPRWPAYKTEWQEKRGGWTEYRRKRAKGRKWLEFPDSHWTQEEFQINFQIHTLLIHNFNNLRNSALLILNVHQILQLDALIVVHDVPEDHW